VNPNTTQQKINKEKDFFMQYVRSDIKGATYFFTVNLADRNKTILVDKIKTLRSVIKTVRKSHPFTIEAMVVLPEHLHTIWTLPEGDNNYPIRWSLIKAGFSRKIAKTEVCSKSRVSKGERGSWQRRYWEHLIRDDVDYQNHVNYIHYNPVKHGYVQSPSCWPYSSIHRFIMNGILESNWGSCEVDIPNGSFGEFQ
jgi:putative transposase